MGGGGCRRRLLPKGVNIPILEAYQDLSLGPLEKRHSEPEGKRNSACISAQKQPQTHLKNFSSIEARRPMRSLPHVAGQCSPTGPGNSLPNHSILRGRTGIQLQIKESKVLEYSSLQN